MTQLARARRLAIKIHKGQYRRGGQPYIVHNYRVARRMGTEVEKAVAWLHDALEMADSTHIEQLVNGGISDFNILYAVNDLTHYKGCSYMEYIKQVGHNPLAVRVKVADIIDNLLDQPSNRQKEKYLQALQYLTARE